MERLFYFLRNIGKGDKITHVPVERRGAKEDAKLELESVVSATEPTKPVNAKPRHSLHAQEAQLHRPAIRRLVAQPIARRVIAPDQPNRAYDIIEKKFRKDGKDNATGYGLKIFP